MSTAQVCCRDGSSLDDLKLYEAISWWIEGVIQIVINVIGIIANCVAIPVLLSRKLTNVFNRTLAILAILDAIFNMCDIFESIRIFHGGECRSLHVYLFPYVLYPLQNITMVASIYTTVIVAIERYYAVTRPISAFVDDGGGKWKKVLIFVIPVLILSIVFNIPTFFEFRVQMTSMPPGTCVSHANVENQSLFDVEDDSLNTDRSTIRHNNITTMTFDGHSLDIYPFVNYTEMRVNEYYVNYYINWSRNIITGVLPIVSLIIFNQLVYKKLVKRRNLWKQDTAQAQNQQSRMKSENRQAHTLFGVVSLFLIGHLFRMILNLHEVFMSDSVDSNIQSNGTTVTKEELITSVPAFVDLSGNGTMNGCSNPNRDCAAMLQLWLLLAKTLSRFLLALSFSGNLIIYCITSDVFRRVLWQQIFCVYYTLCPSQNPNNRRYDPDASFGGGPTNGGTSIDLTRIDRRSPINLRNKSVDNRMPMVKIEKRNGKLDVVKTDLM